jgi:cytoskeletal protein RodZ
MSSRISLSELLAAGVLIRPAEAAAIVAEVCARITRGELRGVPSTHVLRINETGELWAEGPVTAHRATVSRAAQLLDDLIPETGGAAEFRVPGPLRLALLRARGSIDLPPFPGLDAFASAVARFAPADSAAALRDLYERWRSASAAVGEQSTEIAPAMPAAVVPVRGQREDRDLTISDIRRARRATGMTLADVSERCRIPPALLRELEWGYLWNWPGGLYGRAQLVRYARAAGLDERLVVEVAWPMLQSVIELRGGDAVRLLPAEESIDILIPSPREAGEIPILRAVPVEDETPRRRRGGLALAAAAAAAIVISPAAFWLYSHHAPIGTAGAASPASATSVREIRPDAASARSGATTTAASQPSAKENTRDSEPIRSKADRVSERPAAESASAHAVPASAVYTPAFSNEGTAVFFREDDTDGHSSLVRADNVPRGTVLKITRVLDGNARNFHARPSPDGSRVAFDSDREGERAVYVADQDGHNVRRVSGDGFAAVPSWSPDGTRLAFVKAEPDHPDVWNLWTADLATGEQKQVTFNTSGQPWGGSWFPDGRRLAYAREDALVVQDLQSNQAREYRSPIAGRSLRTPAVSPDGRRIIFQVSRDGAWLLDVPTGKMRRVLDDPTAEEYAWAPDGHRVAFHSKRSGGWGVWVMGG